MISPGNAGQISMGTRLGQPMVIESPGAQTVAATVVRLSGERETGQ